MPDVVAAPDKFRGSALAGEVAAAAVQGAADAGWHGDAVPMSDGGEGLLEVAGGRPVHAEVTGPLGKPADAEWRLVAADGPGHPATAVIEAAQANGLLLAGGPTGNDPLGATTTGVGELVLEAVAAGAERVLVGCGGSATTDGGAGLVDAIGSPARLHGVDVVVACDVTTTFLDAARVFGPQKGADDAMVATLEERLRQVAERYREELGVDVVDVPGSGAAGGLAGGLAALGARLVPGFELLAELGSLPEKLERADLVVTGEGHLDRTSFAGKVVGGVLARTPRDTPVLCVVGDAEPAVLADGPWGTQSMVAPALLGGPPPPGTARRPPVRVVRLTAEFGKARSFRATAELVRQVVRQHIAGLADHT